MTLSASKPFVFLEPGPLVDNELELVEPHERWVEDVLTSCHHPLTQRDMPLQARTTRDGLAMYLRHHPRGRHKEEYGRGVVPGYTFWMRLRPEPFAAGLVHGGAGGGKRLVPMAGNIGLRVGHTENLEMYFGHIGYHVYPPARGHHYAERSCRLLFPLARAYGFTELWVTCNPDNLPSRRTCERLGGVLVEVVAVPKENSLYGQGDREKCRYLVKI